MKKTVMIVEDEPALQQAFSMILSIKGFQVHVAANGIEALEMLKTVTPDVILLDMLMPHMGGLEFAKKAGLESRFPDTRVVLLSNLSNSAKQDEILAAGIKEQYLKADVTPDDLVEIVSR